MLKATFAAILSASLLSGCASLSNLGQTDSEPGTAQQASATAETPNPNPNLVPGQQLTVDGQAWMVNGVYTAASGASCAKLRGAQGTHRVGCLGRDGWYLVRDLVLSPPVGGSAR